jgi:UDP-arabinose 4-epimerase
MTMPVLVTGGAGFIGSHTCKALAGQGFLPVSYDDLSTGHAWAVKWGPLEQGSLGDERQIRVALERHRPEAILHFAARAYVGESVAEPANYYRNNVVGSFNLLEAARQYGIRYFVFSSSCAVYGAPNLIPITEKESLHPVNPYGFTKLVVERMLRDFDCAYDFRSVSLRYFNASGTDPEGEIGEDHDPETHLIPRALDAALGRLSHLDVFGDDYETSDGTCIRDYVHVSDLADAHVRALHALFDGAPTTAYNLGTGQGYSVSEVIRTAENVSDRRIPIRRLGRRQGDVAMLVADSHLAQSVLGWKPRFPDLETQIVHAWRWRRRHFGDTCRRAPSPDRGADAG